MGGVVVTQNPLYTLYFILYTLFLPIKKPLIKEAFVIYLNAITLAISTK